MGKCNAPNTRNCCNNKDCQLGPWILTSKDIYAFASSETLYSHT